MAGRRAARPRFAGNGTDAGAGPDVGAEQPADPAVAAREICLRLLTARPRSRAELAGALSRKGIPEDVADGVLDRLDEVGLVDDAAFAELVVRSGHQHRLLGRRALSADLRRRGVADEVVGEAVAAIDRDDEERAARLLVERRLRSMSGLDEPTRVRRLMGLLARRGYPEGLSYRVVREVLREAGSATELPDPEHVT